MSDQTPPPPPGEPSSDQPAGPPPDQAYQPAEPQPAYAAQAQPGQQPGPYTMPPQATDPGKTLGIVGLVLSFFTALIGMIISIVAFRTSKKAGFKNAPALAGIIIGAVFTVIGIIVTIVSIVAITTAMHNVCAQLGPGVHTTTNGTTITCP